jgi:hypothetical protein
MTPYELIQAAAYNPLAALAIIAIHGTWLDWLTLAGFLGIITLFAHWAGTFSD